MLNKIKEKLNKNEFVITSELCPPKGQDISSLIKKAKLLKPIVDAVNITDNQRAIMRMSSLVVSHLVQEEGLEAIFQITCRDRNRIAIQSDLLGASILGLNTVLALTGDYVSEGDHKEAKPVFDLDSIQLIKTISGMNNGLEITGKQLKGKTDFYIGAAVNPGAEPIQVQKISFEKKIQAGAEFFQTQAIYDIDKFSSFMDYAKQFKVKVLAGILLLKSAKMAHFLNNNVPGVSVPDQLIKRMEGAKNPAAEGIKIAKEQICALKSICHGVHIMTVGHEESVVEILK